MSTKSESMKIFFDNLHRAGGDPHWDHDGDIWFWHEASVLFLVMEEGDPEFFRIIMPRLACLQGKDEKERNKIFAAAHSATMDTKNAKVVNDPYIDEIFATAELFIASMDHAITILPRALSAVFDAACTFKEEVIGMGLMTDIRIKDTDTIEPGQVWDYGRRDDIDPNSRVIILAADPRYEAPAFKISVTPLNIPRADAPGGVIPSLTLTIAEKSLRQSLYDCKGTVAVSSEDAQLDPDPAYFTIALNRLIARLADGE